MIPTGNRPRAYGPSEAPAEDAGLPRGSRNETTPDPVADAMSLDNTVQSPSLQSSKRKWTEASNGQRSNIEALTAGSSPSPIEAGTLGSSEAGPSPKRIKVPEVQDGPSSQRPETIHGLPSPIWRKILSLVPPVFLGRLIRVSEGFRSLLDPNGPRHASSSTERDRRFITSASDDIWIASRKRFAPGLPRNLPGKRDLEMWRLIRGNECQICGKKRPLCTTGSSTDPGKAGPGADGVRVIWLLGVRCCGPCLRASSEQDVSLHYNNTFPFSVLPILDSYFLSDSDDFVTLKLLHSANGPSHTMRKYFSKPQIERMLEMFHRAKRLGQDHAEQFFKDVAATRKAQAEDVERWEQWEAKGGLLKVNARPKPRSNPSTRQSSDSTVHSTRPERAPQTSGLSRLAQEQVASPQALPASTISVPSTIIPKPNSLPQRPSTQLPNARPDRNIKDINEAKAARRAEIERRCMNLVPPIPPNILYHMQSYQAALQIPRSLTEREWEFLKPSLVEQRPGAEASEADRLEQERILLARIGDPTQHEADSKEAREVSEREWEAIQAPVRERLARHADDFVHSRWSGGSLVTKDNCPDFAAGLLIFCRRQFYEEIGAAEPSDPSYVGPRKLILENMKWLFDNKVKANTEGYQKEIFLCNTCAASSKYYGFEAVVQHYAAKHTSSLSVGSVIVHWRAEWPEDPPFHPHPSAVTRGPISTPVPFGSGPPAVPPMQTTFAEAANAYAPGMQLDAPPPAPSPFTVPAYPEQSNGYYPGSPTMFTAQGQFSNMAGVPVQPSPNPMPGGYLSSPQLGYGYQPPPRAPPGPAQGFPYSHLNVGQGSFQANAFPNGGNNLLSNPGFDLYQRQMADMAKIAREVWFGINGVKDMPQSVRIYVVIHHVVSRFEKLYTNEPSLSMFIDGLHDNPLMRPVRSLNGLACKACVSKSQAPTSGSHARPQHHALDRRLFTLPLLLNHFRSTHVEGGLATIDFQTGMEASRMDWKRDMIELPDAPIIRDVVNADGMDVKKLELMRPAFPELFGNSEISSPLSDFRIQASHPASQSHGQSSTHGHRGTHSGASSTRNDPISSRSYSSLDFVSRSSPGTPEPPTEHEYDPRRPADFGKIFESNQISRPRSKLSNVSSVGYNERHREPLAIRGTTSDPQGDRARLDDQGAYSSQLLRHHDRSSKDRAQHDPVSLVGGERSSRHEVRLLSDNDGTGEEKHLPAPNEYSTQEAEDEADKFLSDLKPPAASTFPPESEAQSYDPLRQGTISRTSLHSPAPRARTNRPEVVTLVEASTPRTPQSGHVHSGRPELDETASTKDDDHYSPPDQGRSSPRIIFVRDERSGPSEYSPQYGARRSNQIIYVNSGAEPIRDPGRPESGARYYGSPSRRDYDHATQAPVYQHVAPRAYYADPPRYLVPEQYGGQRVLHEREIVHDPDTPSRRQVQLIPVRRDDYDAPRYYTPRSPEPQGYPPPAGYRLESGYGRYTVLVPEDRREYPGSQGTPADVVEYRERR